MQENEHELTEQNSINSKENVTTQLGILEKIDSLKSYKNTEYYDICFVKYSIDSTLDKFSEKFISEKESIGNIGLNVCNI